jgi:pyruvate dehydrogenase E2 component (dihydrolipoamide acetyltransferase)
MTIEIRLPAFSSTMETGKVVKWIVHEGTEVRKGEVLAEVETDKAIAEIEAPSDGTLTRILVPSGDDDVPVNATIAELATSAPGGPAPQPGRGDRGVRASPAARRAARTAGVELVDVTGTGPGGRITPADVFAHAGTPARPQQVRPAPAGTARQTALRQAVARAMVASKTTVPHFYAETEVLIDELLDLKQTVAAESPEARFTLTTFLVLAAARALRDVPEINGRWEDDRVVRQNACDIGVAVAVDGGVVVPVIRAADAPSVARIAARLTELGDAARKDSLRQSDLGGASLTLSNLGMFGIDRFYPVINPPEPLIIGIGRARRIPYVVDDLLGIRTVMTCSFAVDHRVIDGALVGRFADAFRGYLERPASLTVARAVA